MVLLLLGICWLWQPNPHSQWFVDWLLRDPWRTSNLPARLIGTKILLVIWLWVTYRSQRLIEPAHATRGWVGLLAAGVTLLLLAYAVLVSARPLDLGWELTRIHP